MAYVGGRFVVSAPSRFAAEMLEARLHPLIEHTMRDAVGADLAILYTVAPSDGELCPHCQAWTCRRQPPRGINPLSAVGPDSRKSSFPEPSIRTKAPQLAPVSERALSRLSLMRRLASLSRVIRFLRSCPASPAPSLGCERPCVPVHRRRPNLDAAGITIAALKETHTDFTQMHLYSHEPLTLCL